MSQKDSSAGMFKKKEVFTVITPIPGFIPRQLAIDILHSHSEVITLNPLVLKHEPIKAPRDAVEDEYYMTWYEITERIQYVPGMGKLGSGQIKFNGCFHDMPWGLQTHIYAPLGVDLKNKYIIAGNQPGIEPPQPLEMGLKALGAPVDGLYLKEEIEIKANITVVGFVKSQLQKAGGDMVKRIIRKAELLDAGILQAMFENGKLRTVNPADRSNLAPSPSIHGSLPSPTQSFAPPQTPASPPPGSPAVPYKMLRPQSYVPAGTRADTQSPSYANQGQYAPPAVAELAGGHQEYVNAAPVEMPGDYYHPQGSPNLDSNPSHYSMSTNSGRWSNMDSRPTSVASSATGVSNGHPSPGLDHKSWSQELPTHQETTEEHRDEALRKLDPRIPQPSHYPMYNPADYASITEQQKRMQAGYAPQGQAGYAPQGQAGYAPQGQAGYAPQGQRYN